MSKLGILVICFCSVCHITEIILQNINDSLPYLYILVQMFRLEDKHFFKQEIAISM